jgi:four helix bundle protein
VEEVSVLLKLHWSDISGQTGAVSVASNIAEGQGRLTLCEFLRFLGQARGSLLEPDTQPAIALGLPYRKPHRFEILDREIYQVLGYFCGFWGASGFFSSGF